MTPLDLTIKAGRELDALVAEKVMGWTTYTEYVHGPMMHGGANTLLYRGSEHDGHTWSAVGFKPSTDIAAAWEVVERFTKRGQAVFIDSAGFNGEEWRVIISIDDPEGQLPVEAATAPLAICLAALTAVEASA